ncbi:MAG: hypothetical protein JW786_10005 [Desulfobacterales bacterium]|nr:hypothetical protein [Desulfobacterales bacterium]
MSNKPALISARTIFEKRLQSAMNLYCYVEAIANGTWDSISGWEPLHPRQAQKIVALCFMDIVTGLEDFVESCFIRYLAGSTSPNGYKPSLRCGQTSSILHAYQLASGNPAFKVGSHYIQWQSWKDVMEAAKVFFEKGEPFSLLSPLQRDRLLDATKIRNRVAHASAKCKKDFGVISRQHVPKVHQGFNAGQLLIDKSSKCFGNTVPTRSYFMHYWALFESAAQIICPK